MNTWGSVEQDNFVPTDELGVDPVVGENHGCVDVPKLELFKFNY